MIVGFDEFDFINENLNKARSVLRQAGMTQTNPDFVKLRKLLSNNLGYIGKFTEWMILNKVSYNQLENLFDRIKDVNLSKPIDQFNTPEDVIDSLIRKNSTSDLNQMISAIPSNARKLIKDCDDYSDLENFLTQHSDKKDLIIDFFSKKGGRFGDFDEYDVINNIIEDLNKIVDAKSISDISKMAKSSKNIKFLLEDDKVLILLVNYDGIREVGSNYWCIFQDEDTFNDYVTESDEPHAQLVFYFKDKTPFVDDESVLGVTWDLENKGIYAAHWEDDSEYDYHRKGDKIASYLKPLNKVMFNLICDFYDFSSANWAWESKIFYTRFLDSQVAKFKENGDRSILSSTLSEYLTWCCDNGIDAHELSFMGDFIKTISKLGIKLTGFSQEEIISNVLIDIVEYEKNQWSGNMFNIIEEYSVDDETVKRIFNWVKSNGFNFIESCDNSIDALSALEHEVATPEEVLNKFSLRSIIDENEYEGNLEYILRWVIKNDINSIISEINRNPRHSVSKAAFEIMCDDLSKNGDVIIELLSNESFYKNIKTSHKFKLLLKSKNSDLAEFVANSLIPEEIRDLYDIKLTRKVKVDAKVLPKKVDAKASKKPK